MTNEEAKVFLDNLKICIDEHPVVADWLVEIANRKTEPNSSEKPNNCESKNYCDDCLYTDTCDSKEFFYACTSKATISKMEQVDGECADCKWHDKEWWYIKCDGCSRLHSHFEPKDEPMKTTDYCDICKRDMCEDCIADATNPYCVPSHYEINYEPKDEPNSSEKPNNCEHITEDGVTCAKYPACDDCLDNPLNKLKGSERLVKGSEQTDLVEDSPSLVKDLVKAFGEDGTWLERQGVYTLTLTEAKQRAIDIIESVLAKTGPTISKMEQVDKDINVRSKTEPQTERSE